MDKKGNGMQADTAQAENRETMDFLTGMLDNATHCDGEGTDDVERETAPAERSKEGGKD